MSDLMRTVSINGNAVGDDYTAVGEYLSRHQSEVHRVTRPFLPEVVGGLTVKNSREMLRMVSAHQTGIVLRHIGIMKEGVSVSTSPVSGVDVIVHSERWDSKLLSRGLSWVYLQVEAPPTFILNILPEHGIDDQEIFARRFDAAEICAQALVADVLASEPIPSYADRFPDDNSNPNYNLSHSI